MHTAAQAIADTNAFPVKRRLYELWRAHLAEKGTDPLQCLCDDTDSNRIGIGSTVLFGSYPQEDTDPGKRMPIEWEVLDVDGNSLLLVSRYALDAVPYQADGEDVPWEETTLCQWLNGEFHGRAFSEDEQSHIGERGIDCLSFGNLWAYYDNDRYGWLGTSGDDERIFSHLLVADGTPFALAKGLTRWYFYDESDFCVYDSIWDRDESEYEDLHFNSAEKEELIGHCGVCWWLRTEKQYTAWLVTQDGVAEKEYHHAATVARQDVGVRPALWFIP